MTGSVQPFIEVALTTLALLGAFFAARAFNRSRGWPGRSIALPLAILFAFAPIRIVVHPGRLVAGLILATAVIVFGKRLMQVVRAIRSGRR